MNLRWYSVAALTVPALVPSQSCAQANPARPSPTTGVPGDDALAPTASEIIVTARRREENLRDVPIAVTAISGAQLQERQIVQETDLQTVVPGLTIRQNGSANQFNYSIRGQSVDTYTNSPPSVLTYINEAQIVSRSASTLYDLDNVQVLKGPQGTLFGRNTTGGAVLFQTKTPGDEASGYLLGRYGSFKGRQLEGAISIPIADAVGLRVAGSYIGGGAFVRNLTTGERLGDQDVTSVRATLRLKPTAAVTNTTVLQQTREGGNNVPSVIFSYYPCGSTFNGRSLFSGAACLYSPGFPAFDAFVAAHPNLNRGGVAGVAAAQAGRAPYVVEIDVPTYHRARSSFVINTTTFDVSPALTLKNIVSFNDSRSDDGFDYDGTPYPIFETGGTPTADATSVVDQRGFVQATRQFSEEFQLQGKALDNRLNFVLGGFYSNQRDINLSNISAFGFSPIAPATQFAYHQRSTDRSTAVFGQATFAVSDRLNVTGGARYTWDKQTAEQLAGSVFGSTFPIERVSTSKPSWTVSVDYDITQDLMLYVAHRGSWRTGGFNYSVVPLNQLARDGGNRFGPETTRDVEVGFKYSGHGLGLPVTFNANFYNQWVNDIQRATYFLGTAGSATLFTVNVPRAKIRGVEADATVQVAPWLRLGASGAYTNARYTSPRVELFGVPTVYGPFADAPKFTGNASLDASHELANDAGRLVLHAEVYAQSKLDFSNVGATEAPFTTTPPYALVNTRVSWQRVLATPVTASVFVRNLFDKRYWAGGNAVGPALGINTGVPGRPRMIGAELRVDF